METKDIDLASLRIDRPSQGLGPPTKFKRLRKALLWATIVVALAYGVFLLRNWLNPGIPVRLATATLTSPAQATPCLLSSRLLSVQERR